MSKLRLEFKVLIYREDNWWIAHCLEMDLPAEGKTRVEAVKNLLDLAKVQIEAAMERQDLDSIFAPAPAEIWRQFSLAPELASAEQRRLRPKMPVNHLSLRELAPAEA